MIRSLLAAVAAAFFSCVLVWFVIPASTYVENALGILFLVFFGVAALVFVTLWLRRSKPR
ncbi:hypothetical protein [Janthinobacterium fluminis]|uniref:Uncharacterized protein n=1 Tax=Janthinobacterium fluminis TaxID=2987524 RepID=A0ABT5K7A1_9BURK|nr:hypothetical protein [Janthinobacterium fluminis]MDC8760671.1 hypothetical protein [Janthinobacterium fluminis]